MKNTIKAFILFTVFSTQAFADKENLLEDACGHVALSSEQITGLYSWGEKKHVFIGAIDSLESCERTLLDHLAHISFETDDVSPSKELVAERESLGSARYSGIQYCPAK